MAEENKAVDGQDDANSQPDPPNVEQRLSNLESLLTRTAKDLEEERKASSGKDRKITELSEEKKKLQESTLSKDKLLEIRERELEEAKVLWEQQRVAEKIELDRLRIEQLKTQVLSKLENFPSFLIDRVRGTNADEIEADARNMMKFWVKERDKVDNARRVTTKPRSGGGNQIAMTVDDVKVMNSKEKMDWAATASDEEYAEVFDALHSG